MTSNENSLGQCHSHGKCQPPRRIQSLSTQREFWLGRNFVPALSVVYIPGIENSQADLLSQQHLNLDEWSLHLEVFKDLCPRWETQIWISWSPNSMTNWTNVSPGLVSLSCACICDAQWDQFRLICAFTLLKLLSYLLHKIEAESISVIQNWPSRCGASSYARLWSSRSARSVVLGTSLPPCFTDGPWPKLHFCWSPGSTGQVYPILLFHGS